MPDGLTVSVLWRKERSMTEYKGFYIEKNIYGMGEYSVQYCGDDIIFDDVNDAKDFIDSVV